MHGDNIFADLSYRLGTESVTGFAYLNDQDEAAVTYLGLPCSLSSRTYGGCAAFTLPFSKTAKINLLGSCARQSDYGRSWINYGADY